MKRILITSVLSVALSLSGIAAAFSEEKDGVRLTAEIFAQDDIGINAEGWKITAEQLCDNGLVPVRIVLENGGGKVIKITNESLLENSVVNIKDAFAQLRYGESWPFLFMAGVKIADFAQCWEFYLSLAESKGAAESLKIFLVHGIAIWPIIIYWWWYLRKQNQNLERALQDALFVEGTEVASGERVEKVLLLNGSNGSTQDAGFALSLFNATGENLITTFNINLGA